MFIKWYANTNTEKLSFIPSYLSQLTKHLRVCNSLNNMEKENQELYYQMHVAIQATRIVERFQIRSFPLLQIRSRMVDL